MSRSNAGMASHLALMTAFPLVIITGSLLNQAVSHQREENTLRDSSVSRTLSVNGVHDALAQLDIDPGFRGDYLREMQGGDVWIEVVDWATDGVDNDLDGVVDGTSEENLVGIRSTGWVNATLSQAGEVESTAGRTQYSSADVVVRRNEFDVAFEQTVYIDDPLSTLDLNGNAFLVSGKDENPDGTPGPDADRPALGTPGDPSDLISQLSNQQKDNFVGAGGTPAITAVAAEDLEEWADALASMASRTFEVAQSYGGENLGDYESMSDTVIAHAKGDLSLSGGVKGAGILVVDGDLTITGNFAYSGIILCRGSVTFKGGGGEKNLYGALLCLGSVENTEIELSGSVELHYSSMALDTVAQQLASYSVLAWTDR